MISLNNDDQNDDQYDVVLNFATISGMFIGGAVGYLITKQNPDHMLAKFISIAAFAGISGLGFRIVDEKITTWLSDPSPSTEDQTNLRGEHNNNDIFE